MMVIPVIVIFRMIPNTLEQILSRRLALKTDNFQPHRAITVKHALNFSEAMLRKNTSRVIFYFLVWNTDDIFRTIQIVFGHPDFTPHPQITARLLQPKTVQHKQICKIESMPNLHFNTTKNKSLEISIRKIYSMHPYR